MPNVTEKEWTLAMYKTHKNLSIRPEPEVAARIVYLNFVHRRPKASVVKECLESGLGALWKRTKLQAKKM